MAKTAIDAARGNLFVIEPEKLTLVDDPGHPLYDIRVHDDPDESLVRNIMVYGVIEPIIVRKNGDAIEVVAGRGRTKAALEANKRLEREGKMPLRVPVIIKKGQDGDLFGVLVSENECRRNDTPLVKADKAVKMLAMGKTKEEVAIAFGVSRSAVDNWLAMQDLAEPVRYAIETGKITATAAAPLAKLDRLEQVRQLEDLMTSGGALTTQRVKRAVNDGDGKPIKRLRSRKEIEVCADTTEASNDKGDFAKGFVAALRWVLGEIPTFDIKELYSNDER